MEFKALGNKNAVPARELETFPAPAHVTQVTFTSDELTTFCPVTNQPDFSTVQIEYQPNQKCIESKSLKLYLWSYRDECAFCEALAAQIAQDVFAVSEPHWCRVTITQNVRGGIVTKVVAQLPDD